MASQIAIAATIAGVVTWTLAFWWGPTPDYLDQRNKHLLRVLGGGLCFAVAGASALISLIGGH
jgi:hypothetical protein